MADDVASLGFAVDSSQLVAASKALDQVNQSAQRLAPTQTLVATSSQRLTREQELAARSSRAVTIAQAELGDKIELLSKNTDAAYRTLSTRSFFRLLAREASLLGGPLGQAISHFGILTVGGQRLGVGITAGAVAIGGMSAALVKLGGIIKEGADISKSAQLSNIGGQAIQGFITAGGFKGIAASDVLSAMVDLNKQVELAKVGLGSLSALFRANGVAATTTEEAFFKIADLVKNARNEAEKFSILQQAGLPATNQMVILLSEGAAAIRIQANEAAKFNDQQLKDYRRLEDQWNEMWTNFERWGKTAVLNVFRATEQLKPGPTGGRTIGGEGTVLGSLLGKMGLPAPGSVLPSTRISDAFSVLGGSPAVSRPTESAPIDKPTINPDLLKQQLELEKQRITILGQTASVAKEVRLAEIDLQIAALNNVGVTKQQRDSLIELARERALGITGIKSQIDSMNVSAATTFMGAGAAAEYAAKQNIFNSAIRDHKILTDSDKAAIEAQAKVLGEATSAANKMRQALDLSQTFFSGFFTDLSHGVKAIDALKKSLISLSDSLIKMASDQLVRRLLGGLLGGGAGFFGGSPATNPALVPIGHSGGMVNSLVPSRLVDPSYFDNAPRFARGGIVGGEVPIIAHRGEGVFTPAQMKAMGRGDTHVHYNIDASGADPAAIARLERVLAANTAALARQQKGMVSAQHFQATGVSRG